LAELEGEEAEALWGYLCQEWDRDNEATQNIGRKLLRFNFFMLQADVLPNMMFSSTKKRLIHSHTCVPEEHSTVKSEEAEPASSLTDETESQEDHPGEAEL
jgi:hypothetical protein